MNNSALLVSVRNIGETVDPERSVETAQLAAGLGLEIVESKTYTEHESHRFLLGSGQVEDLHQVCQAFGADIILFDSELTPLQYRYLIDHLHCAVMDRARLILETFASHAHTAEAKKRVEIAKRMYELTQLRAMDAGYDQQAGFIGMRGPGETLFQKRRRAKRAEIHRLREQVKSVDTSHAIRMRRRQELPIVKIAVVGYTNAGKSSLINLLAGSNLLAEDKLFATLDTAVRPVMFDHQPAVLIDTVGFIRDLPLSLLDSFRSTLEETREADLLVHIADAGARDVRERLKIVEKVLADIGCADIPQVLVFNKSDTIGPARRAELAEISCGLIVSVKTLEGIDALRARLGEILLRRTAHGHYVIPFTRPEARAQVYQRTVVLSERATKHSWIIDAAEKAPGAGLPAPYLRKG